MPASFFDKFFNRSTTYSNGIVWPVDIDPSLKPEIITYMNKLNTEAERNASYDEHIQNILTLNNERYSTVVANTYNAYRSPWQKIKNFFTNTSEHIPLLKVDDKNNPPFNAQYYLAERFCPYLEPYESLVDFDNFRNINCDIDDSTLLEKKENINSPIMSYTIKQPIRNINCDIDDSTVSTQRASFDKKINEENINSRIMPYTTKNVSFGR